MCWKWVRQPADRRCAFPAPPPFSQAPATFRRYNPAFQNTRPSASRCLQRARIQDGAEEAEKAKVGALALLVQGIATSIDALSVGFTIAEYDFIMALACSLIIAAVTFVISFTGLILGKKCGTKFSNKATILGGAILIAIGIEIFVSGVF